MSDIASEIVNAGPAASETPSQPSEASVQPDNPDNQSLITPTGENDSSVSNPQEDDMSARFAALARKEKMLREQEDKFKQEREKYSKYQDLESKAKENPLEVLERYGLDLDTIIAASLGEDKPAPSVEDQIKALQQEIQNSKEEIKKKEEDEARRKEEEYQQYIDEAILAHKTSITDHLGQNKEKYELIHLQGAEDLVWDVTEAHFEANNGEVLTPEQAADKVEQYLEAQVKKALELERFKSKETLKEVKGFEIEDINPIKSQDKPTTLTSDLSTSAPEKNTNEYVSMEESKRRAAELLKWT